MEQPIISECSICDSEDIESAVLELHEEHTKEYKDTLEEINSEVGMCKECHFENIGND